MNPKSFQVSLRRPLGPSCTDPFIFFIHADSAQDALRWVAQTFEGIDILPTLEFWANPPNPPKVPSVGNRRPVSIIDCDQFVRRRRVNGRFEKLQTEPGEFRRSEADVTNDLRRLFDTLHSAHRRLTESFAHLKKSYEEQPTTHRYRQLEEVKRGAERAQLWMTNVWIQYLPRLKAHSMRSLVMPEPLHEQAPKAA